MDHRGNHGDEIVHPNAITSVFWPDGSATDTPGASMAGAKAKLKQMVGRGGGSETKVTNIVEAIDVGVGVRVAYNQWTQFADFPTFMKKVENVDPAGG